MNKLLCSELLCFIEPEQWQQEFYLRFRSIRLKSRPDILIEFGTQDEHKFMLRPICVLFK